MAQLIDASGVIRFEGTIEDGGSQTVEVVRFPFAFNTPNIVLTGVPVYDVVVGSVFVRRIVSVVTAWDGTTPILNFRVAGEDWFSQALDSADGDTVPGLWLPVKDNSGAIVCRTAETIEVYIDNGAGGNPGSAQGEGEIVLAILLPS